MAWTYRLEPTPATDDIEEGLAAPIHDALWMLTRQWQLGEFAANDAGSPALVHVNGVSAAIGAVRSNGTWRRYERTDGPLDVFIEAEKPAFDVRSRLDAGMHFVRLLEAEDLSGYVEKFRDAHPIDATSLDVQDPLLALRLRSALDPDSLEAALAAFAGGDTASAAFVIAADRARVREVAQRWLAWRAAERACVEPDTSQSWQPNRLEHQAVVASSAGGGTVLRAPEYDGESLDWVDFAIDTTTPAPEFALPAPQPVQLSGVPAPIRYGGMPVARYWELEDGRIDFGNVEAGAHDLGRLLLIEFATVFGNDWFLVPLRLPSGTLTTLETVVVTSVFGEHFLISRAGAQDPTWQLFALDADAPHPMRSALFLPPTCRLRVDSPALEIVHLLRDEMANVVWGIERVVTTAEGDAIDRLDAWRRRPRTAPEPRSDRARYVVETEVPEYWLPLVPEQLADRRSHRLVLVPLVVQTGAGPTAVEPLGKLLTPPSDAERLWLYEEEVPRAGITVERRRRYVRWHAGRSYLWTARSKQTGRGEASSGLRFDIVVPE